MGLCKLDGKFVVTKPSCENFTEVDLKKVFREGGWTYCLACRTPIFSEHLSHVGHDVAFELCFDEVACEDSPSGD